MQSMKAKWDKDTTDKCPFCDECDTHEHRLLHCPIGKDIRDSFPDVIDLQNVRPEWIQLALPRQHEMTLLLRAYAKVVKPPVVSSLVEHCTGTFWFYTDGGAISPAC